MNGICRCKKCHLDFDNDRFQTVGCPNCKSDEIEKYDGSKPQIMGQKSKIPDGVVLKQETYHQYLAMKQDMKQNPEKYWEKW